VNRTFKMIFRPLFTGLVLVASDSSGLAQQPSPATESTVENVTATDGTRIALECAGSGPGLLIVHGGSGDRKRWKPLLPLFAKHFTVCAMDRRGHGESVDSAEYSLKKEFDDVAAVVRSMQGQVAVLGHSYGGICAMQAALLEKKISKLVLYEPPIEDLDHTAVANAMEKLIGAGQRDEALVTFLREVVMVSPSEIELMRTRPSWKDRVAGIDVQLREMHALIRYRFEPKKVKKLMVPTLLITGSRTASPQLKAAIQTLMRTLAHPTLLTLEGQEHNAMDNIPQQFADAVTKFLQDKKPR
jgi:pimeloyl-ACP methyl ester carboxylesterase